MPMLVVQPLQHGNRGVALQAQSIFALAYAQEAAEIGIPGLARSSRSVDDIIHSDEFYLGAHDEAELVGVLTIGPDDEAGQIALTSLVVHPNHQRRGIGTSLVQEALRRGPGIAFSVTASANNGPALSLYRSLDFIEYRRGSMGPDDLPVVKLRRRAT